MTSPGLGSLKKGLDALFSCPCRRNKRNAVTPQGPTQAERQGTAVALDWATATERKSDHFAVERSADGATFDAIGRVEGSGTADTERFDVAVGDLAQGMYGLQVVTAQWATTQLFIRK